MQHANKSHRARKHVGALNVPRTRMLEAAFDSEEYVPDSDDVAERSRLKWKRDEECRNRKTRI